MWGRTTKRRARERGREEKRGGRGGEGDPHRFRTALAVVALGLLLFASSSSHRVILRVRVCPPPPHGFVQCPHSDQADTSQSIGQALVLQDIVSRSYACVDRRRTVAKATRRANGRDVVNEERLAAVVSCIVMSFKSGYEKLHMRRQLYCTELHRQLNCSELHIQVLFCTERQEEFQIHEHTYMSTCPNMLTHAHTRTRMRHEQSKSALSLRPFFYSLSLLSLSLFLLGSHYLGARRTLEHGMLYNGAGTKLRGTAARLGAQTPERPARGHALARATRISR